MKSSCTSLEKEKKEKDEEIHRINEEKYVQANEIKALQEIVTRLNGIVGGKSQGIPPTNENFVEIDIVIRSLSFLLIASPFIGRVNGGVRSAS